MPFSDRPTFQISSFTSACFLC